MAEISRSDSEPEGNVTPGALGTSRDPFSNEVLEIFQWTFYAFLSETMDVFGTVTNIINIVCFVKQGFKDVVNISLLGIMFAFLRWVTDRSLCYSIILLS